MNLLRLLACTVGTSMLVALVACGSDAEGSGFPRRDPENAGFGDGDDKGPLTNGNDKPGTPDDLQACATSSAAAEAKPVYLVFMYDRSGSMGDSGFWGPCKAATQAFFTSNDSKGVSASLQFFPQGSTCSASSFASPNVAMTALPSTALKDALDKQSPNGGTPTKPAMQGAVQYAQQLAAGQAKDGKVAIVLVTDGEPNDCSSNAGNVADVAKNVAATIPTYVIGVGAIKNLNQIAAAGGTKQAILVNTSNPTALQADFQKAIQTIKLSALSCDYKIPAPPSGETFDRTKVNVVYKPNGAAQETLAYNQSCAGGTGWKYDDANSPTRILVCDASCDAIKAKPGAVDVLFGCATKGRGVN